MRLLDVLRLRLRSLAHDGDVDRDLDRELRFHVEAQTEEYIAAGMTPEAARTAALRSLGSRVRIEEDCRDTRGFATARALAQDLRYARRSLARHPLLVAAAVASIALGFAANALVFSLGRSLLFSPPSARQPEQLVDVRLSLGSHVSYQQWQDLRDSGALGDLAGYQIENVATMAFGDTAASVMPLTVTANYFDMLGPPMAIGRAFTAREAGLEREPRIVVVSDGFWTRRLARTPDVLQRTILVNGERYAIVGVLPPDFRSPPGFGIVPELYVPLSRSVMPSVGDPFAAVVQLIGRLRDGQSLEEGRAAFGAVIARATRPGEAPPGIDRFNRYGGGAQELPAAAVFFTVLLVVTGLVLAIACANVAGLLLARGVVRRREIAVRAALGAGRRRIIQQLLADGFWLAAAGIVTGLGLTAGLIGALGRLELPMPLPVVLGATVDAPFVAYALALLVATTLASALAPAILVSRESLTSSLKLEEPQYGHRRLTLRNLLVVGQMAVAVVLLTAAGLFVRNLALTHRLDPGFNVDSTAVARLTFPTGDARGGVRRIAALDAAATRVRSLPGVTAAGYAMGLPLTVHSGRATGADLRVDGEAGSFFAMYQENYVGPGYFDAMGMRLLRGRDVAASDGIGTPNVAVINETFATRHFAGRNPVGLRVVLPGPPESPGIPTTIVGVVSDSKQRTLGEERRAALYSPYAQQVWRAGTVTHVIVRSGAPPESLLQSMRSTLVALDSSVAVDVQTMSAAMAFAFLPSRIGATLLGASGGLGLVLALVGLYAAVAFVVSRRTAEIGIRRALGASGGAVMGLVLKDWARLVAAGVAVGLTGAWFVTRPLSQFLVDGLSASDPAIFVGTPLVLVLLSGVATIVPALAALRVDPARVLRNE